MSMSLDDAIFWIAITVFGAGLYLVPEYRAWGLVLMLIGAGGILYAIRAHLRSAARPTGVMAVLMFFTWAIVGYDIYDRRQVIATPISNVIVAASPTPVAPTKSELSPLDQNVASLLLDFLRLPRPCVLRVAAPPERLKERRLLAGLAVNASIRLLNRATFLIPPCQVTNDDEDANPQLYRQQQYPDSGLAIHTSDAQKETREFLAATFRSAFGMRVADDSMLPDGSSANVIYIQLGHKLFE